MNSAPDLKKTNGLSASRQSESERMNPWLSILIPVYNVDAYLSDCFDSLLTQDLSGVEIIAVDDQSTDTSFTELKNWVSAEKFNMRLLQHAQNQGVSAARNTLLDAAKGEYLWFVDPDDVLAANAVHQLKEIINQHSPDVIMCDFKRWRPDTTAQHGKENHLSSFAGPPRVLLKDAELLFRGLFLKGRLHPWSKISKCGLWDKSLRFPVDRCFEDVVVMPKLALKAKNYFYQDSVWINYRQRAGSIISTPSLKKISDMSISASGILAEWLKKYPRMSPASRSAFIGYCIKIYSRVIKDLAKIDQLTPEILDFHRKSFYENTETNKYSLIYISICNGNFRRVWKILKLFKYL